MMGKYNSKAEAEKAMRGMKSAASRLALSF
jgi:hypothetical protein